MKKLLVIFLLVIFNIAYAEPSVDGACSVGPYEIDQLKIEQAIKDQINTPVSQEQERDLSIPIEIARIREGAIFSFQGFFMNDGLVNWTAFDASRHQFISVQGFAEKRINQVPRKERLSDNQLVRYTNSAGYQRAEFVTIVDATAEQVKEFSCLANQLLVSESVKKPMLSITDGIRVFSLLSEGKKLNVGSGKARLELEDQIGSFISKPLHTPINRAYGYTGQQ